MSDPRDSNKVIDGYTMGQNHILETIWLKYKNNSEGSWVPTMPDILSLHEKLKQFQPKHILELGTGIGCSTEIMALTCPNTSIYTVEQSQKCIDIANLMIPERLKEQIYFKYSEVAVLKPFYEVNPFISFMAYSTPYDWRQYDFIYVDGPGPFMTNRTTKEGQTWETLADLPLGDIINMLNLLNEGTIIYLKRKNLTIKLYQRHLSHYLETVEQTPGYTIFRRNDRPIKPDLSDFMNSDLYIKVLKDNGYFNTKLNE